MSKSLGQCIGMQRICSEEELNRKLIESQEDFSQGDFKPGYEERTGTIYFCEDRINLKIENLKKLDAIAKIRGLQLLYDKKDDVAILGYKRRLIPWPKEIIVVAGGGKRIIVKQPDYLFDLQRGLLEEIGSVFGMRA
jgi:hypothetical protein